MAAAVAMLDSDGLGALSMRRLGTTLNAGATSIYWHVSNKEELLELALDEFWGSVSVPDPEHTRWQQVVTTFAQSLRSAMLAHPWAAALMGQIPSIGPNALDAADRLRRTFVRAGFDGMDVHLASGMVTSCVLGQVLPEITMAKLVGDTEYDSSALMRSLHGVTADFPELVADYAKAAEVAPEAARTMAFDFSLACVLDGLAARLPAG